MKIVVPLLVIFLLVGCAKTKPVVEGETFPVPPKKENIKQPKAKSTEKKPVAKPISIAQQGTSSKKKPSGSQAPTETISNERFGRVAMVNPSARFVILTFPIGEVAEPDRRLNVYRSGLKVAELRVTGPQRENNTVADIVQGSPELNDEVREN